MYIHTQIHDCIFDSFLRIYIHVCAYIYIYIRILQDEISEQVRALRELKDNSATAADDASSEISDLTQQVVMTMNMCWCTCVYTYFFVSVFVEI